MNIVDGLERVRERLIDNGARPDTLALVDTIMKTATQPGADRAQVRSLTELVRRLMRTPVAHSNIGVYDDLATLEQQLVDASAAVAAQRAEEEARPLPKSKKYYKALKDKEKKGT